MEQMLIDILCDIDDFCNDFEEYWYKYLVTDDRKIIPKCNMFLSEIMTTVILFHLSNQRRFKWYYKNLVCEYWKDYFPKRLSYSRLNFKK